MFLTLDNQITACNSNIRRIRDSVSSTRNEIDEKHAVKQPHDTGDDNEAPEKNKPKNENYRKGNFECCTTKN